MHHLEYYLPLKSTVKLKQGLGIINVTRNDTIRLIVYDFLLMFNRNYGSILDHF